MPWRYMGEWGYSSNLLDLGTRWRWAVSFTPLPLYPPGKEPPVPIGQKAEWAPESVWTLWRRENSCSYMDPTIASIRLKDLCTLTGLLPAAAALSPRAFCVAGRPTYGARRYCPAELLPQRPNPGRGLVAAVCNSSKSKVALLTTLN
jgi:hypothetical protein